MKVADQISDSGLCSLLTGTFFYYDELESSATLKLYTDGAPSVGFGGVLNGQWFASAWPNELLSVPVNTLSTALLELYPIVIACIFVG